MLTVTPEKTAGDPRVIAQNSVPLRPASPIDVSRSQALEESAKKPTATANVGINHPSRAASMPARALRAQPEGSVTVKVGRSLFHVGCVAPASTGVCVSLSVLIPSIFVAAGGLEHRCSRHVLLLVDLPVCSACQIGGLAGGSTHRHTDGFQRFLLSFGGARRT